MPRRRLRIGHAGATVARSCSRRDVECTRSLADRHCLSWLYIWLLIAQAILSWLLAFGVVNRYNRAVAVIGDFLYRITEPALRPIRSILPNFGGIDISP